MPGLRLANHDQLGSTRLLTNASGQTVASFSYDPYGRPSGQTGTQTTPFGFAGQYTDPETGFQYLRARYYDPETAAFITRDPLGLGSGETNLYGYAGRDPVNGVDPSGLSTIGPTGPTILVQPVAPQLPEHPDQPYDEPSLGGIPDPVPHYPPLNEGYTPHTGPGTLIVDCIPAADGGRTMNNSSSEQDKKLTPYEIQLLIDAGYHPHNEKVGGKGGDLCKKPNGDVVEKPKGGAGPGDPIGVNINDLPKGT